MTMFMMTMTMNYIYCDDGFDDDDSNIIGANAKDDGVDAGEEDDDDNN